MHFKMIIHARNTFTFGTNLDMRYAHEYIYIYMCIFNDKSVRKYAYNFNEHI